MKRDGFKDDGVERDVLARSADSDPIWITIERPFALIELITGDFGNTVSTLDA